jgi:hypothetical protein
MGYFCVLLTDIPYDQRGSVYGEVFITYSIDLINPRATGDAPKTAIVDHPPQTRGVTNVHRALLSEKAELDMQSTLAVNVRYDDDTGIIHKFTDQPVQVSDLHFQEPFQGFAMITTSHNGTEADHDLGVSANGFDLHAVDADPEHHKWDITEIKERRRFCKIKPLKSIKNGVNSVVHAVKVVAQAGETLSLALDSILPGAVNEYLADVVLSEAAPAALEALAVALLV